MAEALNDKLSIEYCLAFLFVEYVVDFAFDIGFHLLSE